MILSLRASERLLARMGWDKDTVRPVTYPEEREDDANDLVLVDLKEAVGEGGMALVVRTEIDQLRSTTNSSIMRMTFFSIPPSRRWARFCSLAASVPPASNTYRSV